VINDIDPAAAATADGVGSTSPSGEVADAIPTDITNPRPEPPRLDQLLREQADAICDLRKRTGESIVEIGRRLTIVQHLTDHGKWTAWLKTELGWSHQTALNFMRVYQMVQGNKFKNFLNLSIPISSVYLLARPSTPDEARNEVLERAEAGEEMTVPKVKEAVAAGRKKRKQSNPRRAGKSSRSKKKPPVVNDALPPSPALKPGSTMLQAERAVEDCLKPLWPGLKTFSSVERREICNRAIASLEDPSL
jgi:hypothetical protein